MSREAIDILLMAHDRLKEAIERVNNLEQKHVMKDEKMMSNGLINDAHSLISGAIINLRRASNETSK